MRVAVDGRSKAFVVSFRVRQAATTTTVPAPTPVSPPVLKLLHRDRNMFECSWTDSMLQSPSGVEYVLQMCALGSTRWHSRRHGPPTGRRRLGGRPGPPSVSITERPHTSPASFALPRTRSDKWLSLKNQWVQVWRGKARGALVKAQIYAALLTVHRLLPNNDAVSARLAPIRCTMFARTDDAHCLRFIRHCNWCIGRRCDG